MSHNTSVAIGFIIRDDNGNLMLSGVKKSRSLSVPITEALSLREGLLIAIHRGIKMVQVEGDSKLIIDYILRAISIIWCLRCLITDIKEFAHKFNSINFKHIFHKANFAVDSASSLGHLS